MSSSEIYLKRAGAILGPFGPDDVKRMARVGQIRPDDKISKDQKKWHVAANVPGLFPKPDEFEKDAEQKPAEDSKPAKVQPADTGPTDANIPAAKPLTATPLTATPVEGTPKHTPVAAALPATAQPLAAELPAAAVPMAEQLPPMAGPVPQAAPQAAPWPHQPIPQMPLAAHPVAAAPLAAPVGARQPVSPQVREALIRAIFLIDTGRTVEAADLLRQLMESSTSQPQAAVQPAAALAPTWDPNALYEADANGMPNCSDTTIDEGEGIDIDVLYEAEAYAGDPSESDIELGVFLDKMSTRSPRRRVR